MKSKYVKPTIGSERVFSLTSQGCDVNRDCPGDCQTWLRYEACILPWKLKDVWCGEFPLNPVEKS
jgi:hypothetical protein